MDVNCETLWEEALAIYPPMLELSKLMGKWKDPRVAELLTDLKALPLSKIVLLDALTFYINRWSRNTPSIDYWKKYKATYGLLNVFDEVANQKLAVLNVGYSGKNTVSYRVRKGGLTIYISLIPRHLGPFSVEALGLLRKIIPPGQHSPEVLASFLEIPGLAPLVCSLSTGRQRELVEMENLYVSL